MIYTKFKEKINIINKAGIIDSELIKVSTDYIFDVYKRSDIIKRYVISSGMILVNTKTNAICGNPGDTINILIDDPYANDYKLILEKYKNEYTSRI